MSGKVKIKGSGESSNSNLKPSKLNPVQGEALKHDHSKNFTTVCDESLSEHNTIEKGQEGKEEIYVDHLDIID